MVRTKSSKVPRVGSTFRLDEDIKAAMERYFQDVGVPPSEQVRRALRAWLEEKGCCGHRHGRATGITARSKSGTPAWWNTLTPLTGNQG
jgi:hypothetical protein